MVALLGLVGTPPAVLFVSKLTTATAAWDAGMPWLTVTVFVNSLISLFYYLRWIIPSYQPTPKPDPQTSPDHDTAPHPWSNATAVAAATVSVLLGVAAGAAWTITSGPLLP